MSLSEGFAVSSISLMYSLYVFADAKNMRPTMGPPQFSWYVETIFYKGIMPSEKVLDFPVDCNTLTGSVNL